MCRQTFNRKLHFALFGIALATAFLAASTSSAALKKYGVKRRSYLQWNDASPKVEYGWSNGKGVTVIDETGASPVLKKLLVVFDQGGTAVLPQLSGGFIWFNEAKREGPKFDQAGTGNTASSIAWGNIPAWTITGGTWCHSVPSYICGFGGAIDLTTVATATLSTNYDMGDWVFHGTGFTNPEGFLYRTAKANLGNQMVLLYGPSATDGTVPALPLLGVAAVGVSVIAMGVAATRRRL